MPDDPTPDDEQAGEIVELPLNQADDEETPDGSDVEGPADFTHDDYRAATTEAYEGLADMMREADASGPVEQAMTVQIPGLGAGVVGFDDIVEQAAADHKESAGQQPDEFEAEILAELEEERKLRLNLQQRIGTGLGLLALAGFAMYSGPGWFVLFVGVIAFFATGEFYAAARRSGYNPVSGIGLLLAIASFVGAWTIGAAGIAASAILGLVVLALFYVLNARRDPLANLSLTGLGFLWVAGAIAFLVPITRAEGWQQLVALVILAVAGNDVGAFFVGRTLGKHKLAPALSPNKTIEGLFGGVVLTVAISVGVSYAPWFSDVVDLRLGLVTALVVGVLAPLGDLAESLVKRSLETKDMGSILPGHGGVLDRVDSFTFVLPVIYLVYTLLGLLP